jgi:hypothetical protein
MTSNNKINKQDMNTLSLHFTSTYCNAWPKLKFYIDGDLYHDFVFEQSQDIINIPIDLLPGEHELIIELYDKTYKNTVIKDGQIVEDQLVTLDHMAIDDVILPNYLKYMGQYTTKDQQTSKGLTWGVNGQWQWNFATPIIDWAIDEKLKRVDPANQADPYSRVLSQKKIKITVDALREFEKQLNDIDF